MNRLKSFKKENIDIVDIFLMNLFEVNKNDNIIIFIEFVLRSWVNFDYNPYHIKTSPCNSFYMIGTSVMKEFMC